MCNLILPMLAMYVIDVVLKLQGPWDPIERC